MSGTPAGFADFTDLDRSSDAEALLRFLDLAETLPFFREVRRRSAELLGLAPGERGLGLGCGTGSVVREMAARVGPTGRAVGLDRSGYLLKTARDRAAGLPQVEFVLGDAHHLDFENDSFDACQAERVFMYLADPATAFGELVRVARPGARIVVFDPDMEGWMIDSPDRALTRRIMNYWCDSVPNGWMGRRWPGLFRAFGLVDVAVEPMTLLLDDFQIVGDAFRLVPTLQRGVAEGAFTDAEIEPWLSSLAVRARSGRFVFAATNFLAGRKPGTAP